MTKSEFINYLLKTPANTNPNVVSTMLDELGGGGSSFGVFKVAQSVTGYDHFSATLNVWYAHDNGMTWREFVDSEYNPVYFFESDVETHDIYYSHLFKIDGNTVKMGTYYGQNLNEFQEIVGATPDGVIDDTANYTATFDFTEG